MSEETTNVLYKLDITTADAQKHMKEIEDRIDLFEARALEAVRNVEKAINSMFSGGTGKTVGPKIDPKVAKEYKDVAQAQAQVVEQTRARAEALDEVADAQADVNRIAAAEQDRANNADEEKRLIELMRRRSREAQNYAKLQAGLEREIMRVIRSEKQLSAELHNQVVQHGRLTVRLGGTDGALNEHEKNVQDIIGKYEQVDKLLRRVTEGTQFSGRGVETRIGATTFLQPQGIPGADARTGLNPFQLRELANQMDRLGLRGAGTIGSLTSLFGPLGLAIGATAVAVVGLTALFVKLGVEGTKQFIKLTKEAIAVSKQTDSVKASLGGLFGEIEGAEAFRFVREESERIGANVEELFRRITPFVESLDDASEFFDVVAALATLDPAQGIEGATRVVQDALEGNLTPLRRTFALNVEHIREMQEQYGNFDGLVRGLGDTLAARGIDMATLGETAAFTFGRVEQRWRTLIDLMGEPIVNQLILSANELIDFLEENEDDVRLFFGSLGEAVSNVLELLSQIAGSNTGILSEESLNEMAKTVLIIGDSVEAIVSTLLGANELTLVDKIAELNMHIMQATESTIRMISYIQTLSAFLDAIPVGTLARMSVGDATAIQDFNKWVDADPLDQLNQAIEEGRNITENADRAVQAYRNSIAGLDDELKNLNETVNETNEGARDSIDQQLYLTNLMTQQADLQRQYEEEVEKPMLDAKAKLNEELLDAEEDYGEKQADAAIEYNRKLMDIEEESAEARVDLARKNAEAIEDIFRKHRNSIADAATDLTDKEADIARKYQDKVEDVERESAKARIKIEEDYRDRIAEIRRKFLFDMEEAIRANDAVAYLRLQRRMNFELESEKMKRDDDLTDTEQTAVEKREAALREQEREIRDAQITNDRKLRDLQIALDRELQERAINYQRELDQAAIAEQRKRDEAAKTYERNLEDIQLAFDRRIDELNAGYEREIEAIKANSAKVIAALEEANRKMAQAMAKQAEDRKKLMAKYRAEAEADDAIVKYTGANMEEAPPPPDRYGGSLAALTGAGTAPARPGSGVRTARRAYGGDLSRYQPALTGERGTELFLPKTPGTIIPTKHTMMSLGGRGSAGTTNIYNKTGTADVSLLDPSTLSQAQQFMVKQLIVDTLMEALEGG